MKRRRANKSGRSNPELHFTKLLRRTLETPAWRALSASAQALYPWLRLEWKGPNSNTNGKLSLSIRQAAEKMGCARNTAAAAFRDLQAKGFIRVTQPGFLGVQGVARSPMFELTEEINNNLNPPKASMLFLQWKPGQDFQSVEHPVHNPFGKNGNPSQKLNRSDLKSCDIKISRSAGSGTACLKNGDVSAKVMTSGDAENGSTLTANPTPEKLPPNLLARIDFSHCTLRAGTLH